MNNYIIEGNINFYDELYKSLDDEDNDDNVCQITGLPLIDKFVALECNHKFNYDALYKEICRQKFHFKTYTTQQLNKNNLKKFLSSKLDYFIKCPYCRDIQFTILPYYEELGLEQKYGVNSLNKQCSYTPIHNGCYSATECYILYGVMFDKNGPQCNKLYCTGEYCKEKYTALMLNTQLAYCRTHYKNELREYNLAEKKKKMDEKKKKMDEKTKLLEDTNAERVAKGLVPLKRIVKKKVENVVQSINVVNAYVPEDIENVSGCQAILKSGPKKGTACGCKTVNTDGLCKRHVKVDKNAEKNV
jgi:hypothetical protein